MSRTATLRTLVNASVPTSTHYNAAELQLATDRPGCNDHLRLPSRMGQELRYRDGTIQRIPTEGDLAQQALGTGARA